MKAVILCGGMGTRMREETEFRPKPLVDVGGRPILWHIMKLYAHHGFRDFVLCLGYRGNMIKEYFLNYEAMNNDFTICLGRKSQIQFNGDHRRAKFSHHAGRYRPRDDDRRAAPAGAKVSSRRLFHGDLRRWRQRRRRPRLVEFHKSHGKLATVTTFRPMSRFGILDIDASHQVMNFVEKPRSDAWASAGFFVFQREVLDYLDDDECILEKEPLERLAAERQLVAYNHDGFFYAMDTFREYQILNDLWKSGQAPWKVWE